MTREQWLELATARLRDGLFKQHGQTIPAVRLSVGFPGGGSARKRIGEYWHAQACQDGVPQVFISPVLNTSADALATLVHELVHAVTPGAGHKAPFKRVALAVGLTGKMTATTATPELAAHLAAMMPEPYPHAGIDLRGRKKQGTRLIKVACVECGYTCRVAQKWLDQGTPICPCNGRGMA